jgi:hypothetical protein
MNVLLVLCKISARREKKQISTSECNGKVYFSIVERRRGMKASVATAEALAS